MARLFSPLAESRDGCASLLLLCLLLLLPLVGLYVILCPMVTVCRGSLESVKPGFQEAERFSWKL
jgi:hypothetical protein